MKPAPLLLALGLLSTIPTALRAQTPDDSLKGRIWTATAQRIWADTKPRAPQPPAWPTNAAFTSWLGAQGKSEKSGIGLLRGDVVRQLGPGRPATAAQVAQAILAEATNPPRSREWLRKLDVPALQAALRQVVPTAAAARAAEPVADSAAPAGAAAAARPDSLGAALPPAAATITDTSTFFERHPWLAGLLGALLGAVGAAVALRSTRRRHHHHRHSAEALSTPFPTPARDSAEVLRLQNEVQRLAHYIKGLEAKLLHYENANAADVALADEEPAPALEAPVAPAELPHPPAAAPAVAAPAVRYGPVPPMPYLADMQLIGEPLPQLALMLTTDPENAQQATFTLNPHASQDLLLRDGLARLQAFFEYDPAAEPATQVEAAAPGRLQRQGEGWQVAERGWLAVS